MLAAAPNSVFGFAESICANVAVESPRGLNALYQSFHPSDHGGNQGCARIGVARRYANGGNTDPTTTISTTMRPLLAMNRGGIMRRSLLK